MLCALYNGHVHVMNYENQQLVKDFEVKILIIVCVGSGPQMLLMYAVT